MMKAIWGVLVWIWLALPLSVATLATLASLAVVLTLALAWCVVLSVCCLWASPILWIGDWTALGKAVKEFADGH